MVKKDFRLSDKPLKVVHVIPSFYPAHIYGGPMQSVYHLCRSLQHHNCEVRVLTTNANGAHAVLDTPTDREVLLEDELRVRYCPRIMPDSISPALIKWLPHYAAWADVIHITAVYSFPIIPALVTAKLFGKPVVWSSRGMLQQWEGASRPALKNFWVKVCQLAAPPRTVLHYTSELERQTSRSCAGDMPSCIVPNGVEIKKPYNTSAPNKAGDMFALAASSGASTHMFSHNESGGQGRGLRVLFLGRLHFKKGIENLIAACGLLRERDSPAFVRLTIAGGGDEKYAAKLHREISMRGLDDYIKMIGEVTGDDKERVFAEADILVAPSHSENFGMVVVEALARGVPVIASTGMPWQVVEEQGCGLWVDNEPTSLAEAIEKMHTSPLGEMSARAQMLAATEFSWDKIGVEMVEVYRRVVSGDVFNS